MQKTSLAALKRRAACAALALLVGFSQTTAAVSLFDVIEMTKNGYSDIEITKLMAVTGARFEIDALGLMTLTDAGVEESVISRMLDDGGVPPNQISEIAADQMVTLRESGFSEEMILKFVKHRNVCIPLPDDGVRRLQQAGFSPSFMLGFSEAVEACRATRVARAPIEPLPEGSYSTRLEPLPDGSYSTRALEIYPRPHPFYDSYYYGHAVYPVYIYVDHRKRRRGGRHDDDLDNMEIPVAPVERPVGDEQRPRTWTGDASTQRRERGAAYTVPRTATYTRPRQETAPRQQTRPRYQTAPSRAAMPRSAPSVGRSMSSAPRSRPRAPRMPSHAPAARSPSRTVVIPER